VAVSLRSSPAADDHYGIKVRLENNDIFASFKRAGDRSIDTDGLRHIIFEHGYASAFIIEDMLQSVVDAYNAHREDVRLKVGERRDAYCKIIVSADKQKAFLTTNMAYGGRELSRADIFQAIVKAGIRRGIVNQCIGYALEHNRVDRILIARGALPIDGKDSEFKPLISKYRDRRPRIDEQGRAHYQDVGNLVTVSKGEALVQRLPPINGQNGFDVFGNELAARDGRLIPFSSELTGVEIDKNDPNLLRASENGQPLILNHGAIVEKTVRVDDVDLNCGNIEFDGSIAINGNVCTGMSVIASGDIFVSGMVEAAATLRAGGDIVVEQGIIGRGALADNKGDTGKGAALVDAGGSIKARFIEHAIMNAGQSVIVDELLAHSDIHAGCEVLAGNSSSKNGHIRGGSIYATIGISAQVLGSPAGVATVLKCGDIDGHQDKLKEMQQRLDENRQRRRILEQNLARQCVAATTNNAKHNSRAAIQRTQSQLDDVNREINLLHSQSSELKQNIDDSRNRQIHCFKKAYPNIEVVIAEASLKLTEEKNVGKFHYHERQVCFSN